MPDPSRRELERRLDDLEGGGDAAAPEDAYAALVAAASGTADGRDRRVLAEMDDSRLETFVGPADTDDGGA